MRLEPELATALAAATQAASIVMRVYATDFDVSWKGENDPVTDADRRANEAIVKALGTAFPHDGICAEEARTSESIAAAARGGRCWFVDPLDGTREFVAKNGEFCVMVGLAIDGVAQLGVIVAPAWNRTLWGVVGVGAWERGVDGVERRLTGPVERTEPRHARLVVSRSHLDPRVSALADTLGISDVHPCGSVGLKASLVATGEADLYVHAGRGTKLWDGCAPAAIAEAAGVCVTDAAGEPLRFLSGRLAMDKGLVFAPPWLHARVIAARMGTG